MEAVFGLMLMLLGLCQGVVHECDVTSNVTCYGALGGSVLLKMGSELKDRLRIKRNKPVIFEWRTSAISRNELKGRSVFKPEAGTLQIDNLISSDADNYTFIILNSAGKFLRLTSLQLFLQDPVRSVQLHTKCLSEGELRVSCSHVGGDSPHLQWTLDGSSLTDDKLISGNTQTNNITLRQDVSGTLTCSVSNKVSVVDASDTISACAQRLQKICWVKGGVLAALMILLMVGEVVFYTLGKKRNNKKDEDDEQELTYPVVRFSQILQVQPRVQRPEYEV